MSSDTKVERVETPGWVVIAGVGVFLVVGAVVLSSTNGREDATVTAASASASAPAPPVETSEETKVVGPAAVALRMAKAKKAAEKQHENKAAGKNSAVRRLLPKLKIRKIRNVPQ